MYMNIFGWICVDDWDEKDVIVVCRQMGYVKGKIIISVMVIVFVLIFENFILIFFYIIIYFFYLKGLLYKYKIFFVKGIFIWVIKVNCIGSEYKLFQCFNFMFGYVDDCIERYDVGVVCYFIVGKQIVVI